MQLRLFKLRFRRRLKRGQKQVEGLGVQAEAGLEQHFFKRLTKLGQVWRFITVWVLLVGILGAAVVVQIENLSPYYQTTRPIAGGTYTEGVLGTFTNANPLYATSEADTTVSHLVFASLLKYNDNQQLVGDLAQSWSANADGTIYTVHLRPNLTWQDGQTLTADDVVFTYHAIQNPDAQSPLSSSWTGITISKVDNYTVRFELPNPLTSFPTSLVNGIVPAHVLAAMPANEWRSADFNTVDPVGSGPFAWDVLQVSDTDVNHAQVEIALKPFDHYYAGTPKLDSFVVHTFTDEAQLIKAFKHQTVSAMVGLGDVPKDVRSQDNLQQYTFLRNAAEMVFFNTESNVLSDGTVRQALVQGSSVAAIMHSLSYATKVVNEPLLSGQLAYNPAYAQVTSQPVQAIAALTKDGWVRGKDGIFTKGGKPLAFSLTAPDTPETRMVTHLLQAQWRAIGANVHIQLQNTQDFQATLNSAGPSAQYDALLYGISIGIGPDVFVYWDSSQADPRSDRLNFSNYKNPVADSALEAGRTRLDPALRVIKYKPFLQVWQKDAPALGLYQPRFLYMANTKVYGLNEHFINNDTDRFDNVQNWMVRTAKVTN